MPARRKVLHLITSLNTGGAELFLLRLIKHLDANIFESRVVCLLPVGSVGENFRQLGIQVDGLDMHPSRPSLRGFLKLVNLLIKDKPDVLMTWLYHADLLGLIAGKLSGVNKIIWNIRSSDMDFSKYHPFSAWIVKICALLSALPSVVVVNSQAGRIVHEKLGYRPRRWKYFPNGVDLNEFKPEEKAAIRLRKSLDLSLETQLVGMLARFDPMKDHQTFIQAAGQIVTVMPNVRFLVAGDGCVAENQQLNELIIINGLSEKIYLLGNRSDAPAILAGLDVYMASSLSEGFPNAIAEAMAFGVPIAATNAGDSAELIDETGILVNTGDAKALADACLFLLNEPVSQHKVRRKNARKRIEEHFTIENSVQKYQQLLLED